MPLLQYKGYEPRSESAITGRGRVWYPGEIGFVTTARSLLLLAAGRGWETADVRIGARSMRLANMIGTKAAPIASLTGVTSGQLAIGTQIKIPANTLEIGSVLRVRALIDRLGSTATMLSAVRLGTADSVADGLISNISMGATDSLGLRVEAEARVQSATGYVHASGAQLNTTVTAGFTEVSGGNFNIASDMFVSFHIASANAADTNRVLAITVDVEL